MGTRRLLPLVLVALLAVPAVAARNPKAPACRAALRACTKAAATAFAAARTACRASATPAERRACVKAARRARATARKACRATFRTCLGPGGGGGGGGDDDGSCASAASDWLTAVNLYRGLAGLPAVVEDPALTAAAQLHAEYATRNDEIGHTEDPTKPGYTDAGATSAAKSNVAGTSAANAAFGWAIDGWMQAPFHAVGVLDPRLGATGFGIAHDAAGNVRTAAALDVLSTWTADPSAVGFPILFPGDGAAVPLDRYEGNERPDPLASCPGYTAPTGLPLVVQLAAFGTVTASGLARDGQAVEHCVFDGTTYANADPASQSAARAVLAARNAIVIVPRETLRQGSTYDVSLTAGGETIAWRFTLDCHQ
jgi:uncharacterized protein YkwD